MPYWLLPLEETGCGGALLRIPCHLSTVSALGVGCRIRRGCECVCAALQGARAETEIRREIGRVLPAGAAMAAAAQGQVIQLRPAPHARLRCPRTSIVVTL